jgi:hypothetical protein
MHPEMDQNRVHLHRLEHSRSTSQNDITFLSTVSFVFISSEHIAAGICGIDRTRRVELSSMC